MINFNIWLMSCTSRCATSSNQTIVISFLFLHKNICCGHSSDVPQRGASNECPQCIFSWKNKKTINLDTLLIWRYDYCPHGEHMMRSKRWSVSAVMFCAHFVLDQFVSTFNIRLWLSSWTMLWLFPIPSNIIQGPLDESQWPLKC